MCLAGNSQMKDKKLTSWTLWLIKLNRDKVTPDF